MRTTLKRLPQRSPQCSWAVHQLQPTLRTIPHPPSRILHFRPLSTISKLSSYPSESTAPLRKDYISSTQTFYDLFPKSLPDGPPPRGPFKINSRALRSEFLKLQQTTHPDLFATTSSSSIDSSSGESLEDSNSINNDVRRKKAAEQASATLNRAHATLQDPLQRAQYILSLRGIDVANDETAKVEDQAMLMQVLEIREDIEAATDESQIEGMREENDVREAESVQELDRCFREDDLEGAKRESVRLRYWINVKDCLRDWAPGRNVVLIH